MITWQESNMKKLLNLWDLSWAKLVQTQWLSQQKLSNTMRKQEAKCTENRTYKGVFIWRHNQLRIVWWISTCTRNKLFDQKWHGNGQSIPVIAIHQISTKSQLIFRLGSQILIDLAGWFAIWDIAMELIHWLRNMIPIDFSQHFSNAI